ncbi:hypothetical protein Pint_03940 [Pistacia integerrima]|uniref:Uncharacterized protein n=1 Tax=Pistacia integerrima TaxID=434235 RepID=A0ACC0Z2V6_9ROSI|nr:hypothetical protein Pint_03940 [Pistacia integerrima]
MTPLVDVVAIDASATLVDFHSLWVTHQYSRVPMFEQRVDNIFLTPSHSELKQSGADRHFRKRMRSKRYMGSILSRSATVSRSSTTPTRGQPWLQHGVECHPLRFDGLHGTVIFGEPYEQKFHVLALQLCELYCSCRQEEIFVILLDELLRKLSCWLPCTSSNPLLLHLLLIDY